MNNRNDLEADIKKRLQFLNERIRESRQENKNDYELGYLVGQKYILLKILEIIKIGGL